MKKIIIFGNTENWDSIRGELEVLLNKHALSMNDPKLNDKLLVKLTWKGFRGFDGIYENFIILKEDWVLIKEKLMSTEIYFGEIAGKHSEILGVLDKDEVEEISDPKLISEFQEKYGRNNNSQHSFLKTMLSNLSDNLYDTKDSENNDQIEFVNKLREIVSRVYE